LVGHQAQKGSYREKALPPGGVGIRDAPKRKRLNRGPLDLDRGEESPKEESLTHNLGFSKKEG